MNKRRPRSDDVLFISALLALLLGAAFLMYTTGAVETAARAWPFLVIAIGGFFLYLALVRRFSFSMLFVGMALVLEGVLILVSMLLGWRLNKVWPFGMALAGLAGFAARLASRKRMKVSFAVPSIGFVLLGLVFAMFSFGLVGISFKSFIAVWWPTLLIIGGISLFVAYGASRSGSRRRTDPPKKGGRKGARSRAAGRSGSGGDPTSGS